MADKREVKMTVVDGVRYRPEDAPESSSTESKTKARTTSTSGTVQNKSRTVEK